jgi:putative membrane protein insertion efficiency factor
MIGTSEALPVTDGWDRTGSGPEHGPAAWLIRAVRGYQLARSGRVTGCRYLPTCSDYAIQAIGEHGARRGSALALRRLARCTPWGGHGIDPVPDRRTPCRH